MAMDHSSLSGVEHQRKAITGLGPSRFYVEPWRVAETELPVTVGLRRSFFADGSGDAGIPPHPGRLYYQRCATRWVMAFRLKFPR